MNHNGRLNTARFKTKAHSMMAPGGTDVFDGSDTPKAENSKRDVAQDKKEAKSGS